MHIIRDKKAEFLLLLIFLLASIFFFNGYRQDKKIKNNHTIVCGTIISNYYSKGNYIKIEFLFENKKIETSASCSIATKNNFEHGINKILLAIEKKRPENNNILENPKDFTNFLITKEDTLGLLCNTFE